MMKINYQKLLKHKDKRSAMKAIKEIVWYLKYDNVEQRLQKYFAEIKSTNPEVKLVKATMKLIQDLRDDATLFAVSVAVAHAFLNKITVHREKLNKVLTLVNQLTDKLAKSMLKAVMKKASPALKINTKSGDVQELPDIEFSDSSARQALDKIIDAFTYGAAIVLIAFHNIEKAFMKFCKQFAIKDCVNLWHKIVNDVLVYERAAYVEMLIKTTLFIIFTWQSDFKLYFDKLFFMQLTKFIVLSVISKISSLPTNIRTALPLIAIAVETKVLLNIFYVK